MAPTKKELDKQITKKQVITVSWLQKNGELNEHAMNRIRADDEVEQHTFDTSCNCKILLS